MTPSHPTSSEEIANRICIDLPKNELTRSIVVQIFEVIDLERAESTRLEAELSEVKSQLSEAKRVEGKMKQVLENIAREKDCPSLTHCSCACSYEIQAAEALVKRGEEKP